MSDKFSSHSVTLNSPANEAAAVTKDDDNDLAVTARALFVGTGGHLKVLLAGSETAVIFKNLASGQTLSVRAKRVYATDSTAADIVALW